MLCYFLGIKSMVDALLGRVRHYCHTVTINGPRCASPKDKEDRVEKASVTRDEYIQPVLNTYRG